MPVVVVISTERSHLIAPDLAIQVALQLCFSLYFIKHPLLALNCRDCKVKMLDSIVQFVYCPRLINTNAGKDFAQGSSGLMPRPSASTGSAEGALDAFEALDRVCASVAMSAHAARFRVHEARYARASP